MADDLARWVAENEDHFECCTAEDFDQALHMAIGGCREAFTASWTSYYHYQRLGRISSVFLNSKEEKDARLRWLKEKDTYLGLHTEAMWTFWQRTTKALIKLRREFRSVERRHPADLGSDIVSHLKEVSRVSQFVLELSNDMIESVDTAVCMSLLPFYSDY